MSDDRTVPYDNSVDHLFARLELLDLRLRARLAAWHAATEGVVDEYRGLYVPDEAIDRILEEPQPSTEIPPEFDSLIERAREELAVRETATAAAGTELRLLRLADLFGLGPRELDALLVALAPELDLSYETLYSYLQNDVTKKRPTVDLVLTLCCDDETERVRRRDLFARRGPLRRHRLVSLDGSAESRPLLARFVAIDKRVVDYLLESDELDARLAPMTERTDPANPGRDRVPTPLGRRAYARVVDLSLQASSPMVFVHGPEGTGKRTVAAILGTRQRTLLLTLDATGVDDDAFGETLTVLRREAALQGAAVHLTNLDGRSDAVLAEAVKRLDAVDGPVVLSAETPWRPRDLPRSHSFVELPLTLPSYARRRRLWERFLGAEASAVDTAALAGTFRLSAGGIRRAVASARNLCGDDPLTPAVVVQACRKQSRTTLDDLASEVAPVYTWDDIVLPPERLDALREVAAHIRHRGTVYADWGFERKFSLGTGLVVLFSGSTGTGKTMAAEIIADDANLDLYKIDLSRVVSKYIGETEKNLRAIFDEAEGSSAILLFDEADALFGKRSEVKDSHDRYANIEVNYLLQRIEEHDGVVILTSNLEGNIDDAFLRRIQLTVEFPRPDPTSRTAIWERIFPRETPLGDLDIDFLTGFDLAGGNIKNIAQTAAIMAAEDGERVEMEHVMRATKREFQKTGKLIRPEEFGEYAGSAPRQ